MIPKQYSRRSFLQGVATARELAIRVEQPCDLVDPTANQSAFLVSVRRRAMACEFEVQLAANRHDDSMQYVFDALDMVEALESQMTVFRDDSEVIRINRRAAEEPVPVESRLFELLQQAQRLHEVTGGALD